MPEIVRVVSRRVPAIRWSCRACHDLVPFDCSERFRANSNGKLVDIWLIYRCRRCEARKNLTVVERRPVSRVPRPLLHAAQTNDAALARQLARDVGLVRRNGAVIADGDEWEIDAPRPGRPSVVLDLAEPMLVRLDAVVAAATGWSRRAVRAACADGALVLSPPGRVDALRLWSGPVSVSGTGRACDGPASSAGPSPAHG